MKKSLEKRGQKLARRFTRLSKKVGEEGADHIKENLFSRLSHVRRVRVLVLEWSLLVIAMVVLSLVQAYWYSDSYATETYTKGGTYIEATLGKVSSLNPLFATTSSEQTLSKLMFSTLTATDYSGHTGLGLAESVKTDESAKVWTLKLREGLEWSDGEPITNEDVIFTVDLIKNPKTNTSYTSNLAGIEVSENEEGELVFTLQSSNVYFSSALNIPIVPKHILGSVAPELILEDNFSTSPVTSGAFTYNASQAIGTAGEKIVYLTPNTHYYAGTAMLDSFAVHAFMTKDEIISAVNSGTVSATAELGSYDQDSITNVAVSTRQTSLSYGVYAFLNLDSATLKSQPLRKAIQSGLNMTNLRSSLGGEQALDYPLISSQIKIEQYPELPEEDFLKARSDISTILGANSETEISVVTIDSGYLPTIANSLVEQLNDLGLNAKLETYDANQDFVLNVLRPRAYDILVYEIGLGPDPDLIAYYHSSQASSAGYNLSNYKNSIVNDMIVTARGTLDYDERVAKYESFLNRWVEDVPAIGIYQTSLTYYVNKNVRTFSSENRLVYATDRFNDVIYWATTKTTKNRTP